MDFLLVVLVGLISVWLAFIYKNYEGKTWKEKFKDWLRECEEDE